MSEQRPTETHPNRVSQVVAVLLSAAVGLILALTIGAFQIAGVISMGLAHMLIVLAWSVAVFAVWGCLSSRTQKHVGKTMPLTAFILGIIFFCADFWMVRLKAEQEHRPPPNLGEWLSPVTTYMQSLPWPWIAAGLVVGFLLAVWVFRALRQGEGKQPAGELESRQEKINELERLSHVKELESAAEESRQKIALIEAENDALLSERDSQQVELSNLRTQHQEFISRAEAERAEANARLSRVVAELSQQDARVAALQKPQVEIIYKPEPPYRRTFPSPNGRQQRIEFYIGVECYVAINNLRVEIEGVGVGGELYPRFTLREAGDTAPGKREPQHERLFYLAEGIEPDGSLTIQADTTENYPWTFNIIVSGDNTLPLKKRGQLGQMGKISMCFVFHIGD